ncbi:hypothetical protein [Streptococcus ruminantium]|uniref:hypothetical protein n=1 Tax=Streptococcus ruminantium TaxID=1917441 RepID=UPI00280FF6B4|nr:hypothetical protein [Streptococcus ruminantium]MDQ8759360.1 hypothetical protein [Streptococcus ruminantium]MDQ8764342.1 hypothetical protein [Streptococcus ruminantium]MDQ8769779.1 hypothetical protein [Streptococcus ruminantium]MDQ8774511.1 hypothetical protein [Streptococcus ruminantium]MDQ8794496.1 hypothetical protein [Streptococcus ruminantium]
MIEIEMLSGHWEKTIIEWYLDTLSEKVSQINPLLIIPEEISYLVGGVRELRIEAGTFLKKNYQIWRFIQGEYCVYGTFEKT